MKTQAAIANTIQFVLTYVPAELFVVALIIAIVRIARTRNDRRTHAPFSILTDELLFWAIALPGLWGGIGHTFFSAEVSKTIGWAPSPFEYEVGMANFAIGITALVARFASRDFKVAAALAAAVFLIGDAIGHVVQIVQAHNFATNNAGPILYLDVLVPVLTLVALFLGREERTSLRY